MAVLVLPVSTGDKKKNLQAKSATSRVSASHLSLASSNTVRMKILFFPCCKPCFSSSPHRLGGGLETSSTMTSLLMDGIKTKKRAC